MSLNCLETKNNYFKMRLGRLICSFILYISLIVVTNNLFAQVTQNESEEVKPFINLKLADLDGDNLNDAEFENANIKLIISSKTGTISFYYLKGKNFEENLYPPVNIATYGYSIDENNKKVFVFDNAEKQFSNLSYNIEIERQDEVEAIIKVTANTSTAVDDNTPDNKAINLVRRFIFSNQGYAFKIDNQITNLKEKLINVGNENNGSFSMFFGPGLFLDMNAVVSLLALKDDEQFDQYTNTEKLNEYGKKGYLGIGIKDQYVCVLMEIDQKINISGVTYKINSSYEGRKTLDVRMLQCTLPKFNLGAKESRNFVFQVYAGPLIINELSKINRGKIADNGWLVKQLTEILRFFYSIVPNYGIAIILLTLLVRLILYPLTLKQTKEMAKMQKIQPKVKDLQLKYRDDPQKLNEEVMKLYTKNNVNPLGGCLPLFLQFPVLIALFHTLRGAVDLRKAPFLWMSDLSKSDPYLILPIAIGVLMYLQQKKANIDPQQAQAMAFMPIMMIFFTYYLPSGLLVYWFASSVLGILQQLQANRYVASMKEEQ